MSILRKLITETTSAIIGLDEIKSKSYRFWVMAPPWFETSDSYNYVPLIREKTDLSVGHPFLRPFDRCIYEGIPDIGKVFFILLRVSRNVFPKVLCSITLSKNNKQLYIYPAWGQNDVTLNRGGVTNPKRSPIHHITLRMEKKYQMHMSATRNTDGAKQIIFPAATLRLKNDYGIHIGTFIVNSADLLDSGGIVSRNLSRIPQNIDEMNKLIKKSVNEWHPIIEIPQESKWTKENRLEISFILTNDALKDVAYPTGRLVKPPKEFLERLVPIKLNEGIYILMKISTFPGQMDQSFKWVTVPMR